MLSRALPLLLPLALLTACASTTAASPSPAGAIAGLQANHWQLRSASDSAGKPIAALATVAGQKPVQLDFGDRLSTHAGCNQLSAGYSVSGTTLSVGNMISTMIGCPPALAQRDRALGEALENTLTIRTHTSTQLVLVTAGGDVLDFTGVPTAETRFGGPGQIVFLEVAPQLKPCSHGVIADAQCLQVRPVRYDEHSIKLPSSEDFSHFHGQIEGYDHQPGIRNVLRVKRFEIVNPPADGSSLAYVLDMVVESENTAL